MGIKIRAIFASVCLQAIIISSVKCDSNSCVEKFNALCTVVLNAEPTLQIQQPAGPLQILNIWTQRLASVCSSCVLPTANTLPTAIGAFEALYGLCQAPKNQQQGVLEEMCGVQNK
jgi:hypothetical protein